MKSHKLFSFFRADDGAGTSEILFEEISDKSNIWTRIDFPLDIKDKNYQVVMSGQYTRMETMPFGNFSLFYTSYLPDFIQYFYPQNGICIQKYHCWPKNDGEKWSRKNYFEIPSCGNIVIFITEFVILGTFYEVRESSLLHGGISRCMNQSSITCLVQWACVALLRIKIFFLCIEITQKFDKNSPIPCYFLLSNSSQKNPPKNFLPKIPPKIQKISKKFLRFWKYVSYSLHCTWRTKTLSGLFLFDLD